MPRENESLVNYLVSMWQEANPLFVTYTHEEDSFGQTNTDRAMDKIIAATLAYIKKNKL